MRRRRFLLTPVACLVLTAVVSCTGLPLSPVAPSPPSTPSVLPHAVAPPDAGVAPPVVRLLGPNPLPLPLVDRPQDQLAVWANSLSDGLNIPRVALAAYGYAQRALQRSQPKCGMTWTVLAGIGQVESDHGRFGGARLDASGHSSIPIRGIPLSGMDGTKRIQDTGPNGSPEFVRAIGPFQFLPQTWQIWGRDADGAGVADPDDIYDAALAAGAYLCSVAGDIRKPDRFWAAVLAYNDSRSYGQEVLDYADYYGRKSRELLTPAPSGAVSPLRSAR